MKIKKVLLLGSGALKIGEAGEFDYSGTQAIKALKEEGVYVVLVNPNVATIQTSKGLADKIYFLPVTAEFVEKVIHREKPDGILLSFGGQTALNCGLELYKKKILQKNNVRILGTPIEAIIATEDREQFSTTLNKIGLKTAIGKVVTTVSEGLAAAQKLGYPVMLRSGFALGGTGSGVAHTTSQLEKLLHNALAISPQAIVEEDLTGWKEVEYEVVRDNDDNCITVCNMENFDPVGIHTGESIVIAPSQTLSNKEYYQLRQVAIDTIRELKIVGECNIQYALHPKRFDYRIIEVNARLSRSSALASKATGYPLAYVAAKLALGKTLPMLKNQVTGKTSAFFEPALDYVVVKMPRWDLDKLTGVDTLIGSEMKSVGEVMAVGRTFPEAVQKAARMLNDGYTGVLDVRFPGNIQQLLKKLHRKDSMRLFTICSALAEGIGIDKIHSMTKIDPWFLSELQVIADIFIKLKKSKSITQDLLLLAKKAGFSDVQLAHVYKTTEQAIRQKRLQWRLRPFVKRIDTMAGEFPAKTNYLYMTYNASGSDHHGQIFPSGKVAVIGSGPYAIGTSVEFDWCAVQTVLTARNLGYKTIMINCNPETVSTDFDYSDFLYFEELTLERVLDIFEIEKAPFIVSVGGQIPNNLAQKLSDHHVPILGTTTKNIHRAEHRQVFSKILDQLEIKQPIWAEVESFETAIRRAEKMGWPLLLRPSFVLSGKGMTVIYTREEFKNYLEQLPTSLKEHPLLMTRFFVGAAECDFDGVADHGILIASALSEHVEHGGVHSGDATLMFPAYKISREIREKIFDEAKKIVKTLEVHGPINIQFLIYQNEPYVIECNLRASRSFPFITKTLNINLIELATKVILGKNVKSKVPRKLNYFAVKVPQFSFNKLRGADPLLRVEMSSTGEVAAFGEDVHEAFLKGWMATGKSFPVQKSAFVSLGGMNAKLTFLNSVKELKKIGFQVYTTVGTALFLKEYGIDTQRVGKIHEDVHPNSLDLIREKKIDFAIVIPETSQDVGKKRLVEAASDGYYIRRMAIDRRVPLFTNCEIATFFIRSIARYTSDTLTIKSWNEYVD